MEELLGGMLFVNFVITMELRRRTSKLIDKLPNRRLEKLYSSFFMPILSIVFAILFLIFSHVTPRVLLIVLSIPYIIILLILIEHFINYHKNISISTVENRLEEKTIILNFVDGDSIVLNKQSIKTIFNYQVDTKWVYLPWMEYEFDKIVMNDDSILIINSLDCNLPILNLLLTHYDQRISESTSFTNKIRIT